MEDSKSNSNDYYQWRLRDWFLNLDDTIHKKMKLYFDLLIKFNKTINLVSGKTLLFADALHFSDSILGSQLILKKYPHIKSIYDIGSGNGFPGLVFGILYPQIQVFLVDSDVRKTEFLKNVVHSLELKNVSVLAQNVETLKDNSVEFALTRGFASISKTVYILRKAVNKGGAVFHFKSEEWANEVTEIPAQLCSLWFPSLLDQYKIPLAEIKFSIVKTTKTA